MGVNPMKTVCSVLMFALLGGCLFVAGSILAGNNAAAAERFVTLDDGTVQDRKSGLIWAAQDNGANILWKDAAPYCERFSVGEHKDWRMPTAQELATLYGNRPKTKGQDDRYTIDVVTKSIKITAPWVWTNKKMARNKAIAFGFNDGKSIRLYRGSEVNRRVLPVRSTP